MHLLPVEFSLTTIDIIIISFCGVLIGMSKTGVSGAGLIVIPIMAGIFGGKISVGIVLPLLLFADVFAVVYYKRNTNWYHVLRLMPWAIPGIALGAIYGKSINDVHLKQSIAIMVIVSIAIMIWQDLRKSQNIVASHWVFAAILGLAGGFTSMVGNAAGPIFSLYLLSMHLDKKNFIGTGAWFFFILNWLKLFPLIFYWKKVNLQTLQLNLFIFPLIVVGAFLGIYIVKLIPEKGYRLFIFVSTLVSALFLF